MCLCVYMCECEPASVYDCVYVCARTRARAHGCLLCAQRERDMSTMHHKHLPDSIALWLEIAPICWNDFADVTHRNSGWMSLVRFSAINAPQSVKNIVCIYPCFILLDVQCGASGRIALPGYCGSKKEPL